MINLLCTEILSGKYADDFEDEGSCSDIDNDDNDYTEVNSNFYF